MRTHNALAITVRAYNLAVAASESDAPERPTSPSDRSTTPAQQERRAEPEHEPKPEPERPYDTRSGAPLGALLEDRRLGLSLVVGDPTKRFLNVRWPEREPDRRWLEPGDLRLVGAGAGSGGSFEPLLRSNPAAIVYALTPSDRRLPDGLATRAQAAGVTLLLAPPSTAPERVEAAALRLLAAVPRAAAVHAPQAFLLAALEGAKPERDVLERLHELTGADLVLLGAAGEVVARAGQGTWRPRSETPIGAWAEGRARLDGKDAFLYRVSSQGRLRTILLVFPAGRLDPRPWAEFARTLLAMAYDRRASEALAGRTERAGLLALWLAAPTATGLGTRLAAHGFGPRTPYRVAVGEVAPPTAGAATSGATRAAARGTGVGASEQDARASAAGCDHFAERAVPVLSEVRAVSEVRAGRVVWLFADTGSSSPESSPHAQALLRAMAEAWRGETGVDNGPSAPRLGISEVVEGVAAAPEAYRRAALALEQAAPGSVEAYEPDVVDELLRHQTPEQLRALRETVLGTLAAGDPRGRLRATLDAYLRNRHDLPSLAAELGVHVNTLRYRLKRVEELLGAQLTDPETIAKVWLATRRSAGDA